MFDGCWPWHRGANLGHASINTAFCRPKSLAAAAWVMLFVVWTCRACPAGELYSDFNDPGKQQLAEQAWEGYRDPGVRFWMEPPGPVALTIDWRVLTMFDSHTSYQFGTPPQLGGAQYAPISELDWSLDSTWTGFRFGLEKADSADSLRVADADGHRWKNGRLRLVLAPIGDPDSLSRSPERWTDGQMLDLEYEFRLLQRPSRLPVEVWPMIGFRWQRFDLMAHDGDQLINDGTLGPDLPPVGYHWTEDECSFNQQYSIGYVGAQLRGRLETRILPPIALTAQGDWGYAQANNVDHHISGYEAMGIHRYTMDNTHGSALHFRLTAESLFCRDRVSIGIQADYMEITTTGSHHWVVSDDTTTLADETWSNGVSVDIALERRLRRSCECACNDIRFHLSAAPVLYGAKCVKSVMIPAKLAMAERPAICSRLRAIFALSGRESCLQFSTSMIGKATTSPNVGKPKSNDRTAFRCRGTAGIAGHRAGASTAAKPIAMYEVGCRRTTGRLHAVLRTFGERFDPRVLHFPLPLSVCVQARRVRAFFHSELCFRNSRSVRARTARTTFGGRKRDSSESSATEAICLISELETWAKLAVGDHEEGFHVGGQAAVGHHHGQLGGDVGDGPHAAHHDPRPALLHKRDRQARERANLDVLQMNRRLADQREPFFRAEHRLLLDVHADAHDQAIEELARPVHHVEMAEGDRVEGAGIDGDARERVIGVWFS